MNIEHIQRQMKFLVEIDRLKQVLRRTPLINESRHENSAEHCWHVALAAMLLAGHSDEPLDATKVVKLLLIHDIVEIDAGDTFCYDEGGLQGKVDRERRAAKRIFGILPEEQGSELLALWEEFEACETNEARFAALMDRVVPFLQNFETRGGSWKEFGIDSAKVRGRLKIEPPVSAPVERYLQEIVRLSIEAGFLKE